MNERIRELALKAMDFQGAIDIDTELKMTNSELAKFAELIVQECAELTLDHKNDDYYAGWLDYRDEIRRHFGVEQ